MQKFTRALTREIEVGGERLAVTFSQEGIAVRPVGSRRPPHTMSWAAWVCAAGRETPHAPSDTEVSEAIKAIKAGGPREPQGEAAASRPNTKTTEHATDAAPAQSGEEQEEASPSAPSRGAGDRNPAPHSSGNLKEELDRLDHWLAAHRARYHKGLLPGANDSELQALQEVLGRPLPAELRTWLAWHNGQDPDVWGALEENWRPMSAGEIAQAKRDLDAEGHPGWDRNWIPLLEDDKGDYLCLDPTQPGTPVRECWRGQAEHAIVAGSLARWVEQFLAALKRGEYAEDPERGGFHRR